MQGLEKFHKPQKPSILAYMHWIEFLHENAGKSRILESFMSNLMYVTIILKEFFWHLKQCGIEHKYCIHMSQKISEKNLSIDFC